MKRRKILLYFSIIFLMFLSITNVNAADNVKIKSVELVDESANFIEASKATFDGLTINFDLKFKDVNDYAKYKVVVENKENKNYEISVDSEFNDSKYITYEYDKTDNIKANSESEFYVTVTYKNEVDDSNFSDRKYSEKNNAVLKLSGSSVSNPETSSNEVMIIIGLVVMMGILFVLFRNNKTRKISVFILLGVLSMPLFVKAIEHLKITVNSNVSIEKGYSVGYVVNGLIKASDVDDFDLSDFESITYLGSVSEENKYLHYFTSIYKGKKVYASGETVKFNSTPINVYASDISGCEIIHENDGSYYWICDKLEKKTFSNSYQYNKETSEYFGYSYNDDDNTVMKFTNASDSWKENGKIIFSDDSTFIMPNHDVLISGYSNIS